MANIPRGLASASDGRDCVEPKVGLLARNACLSLGTQILPLVIGVITVPAVLRGLGSDRFGLLSLIWAAVAYFGLLELGLSPATTRYVADALGRGGRAEVVRIVWSAAATQACLGFLGAVATTVLTPIFVEQVFKIPSDLKGEAILAFRLLGLVIPLILISGSLSGVLEAAQRFDLSTPVKIFSNTAVYLSAMVASLFGFSLWGIVSLIVVAKLATVIAYIVINFKLFPELKTPKLDCSTAKMLVNFGIWIALARMLNPVLLYLDRFLLASFLPVGVVGYYAAPFEIVNRLWVIPGGLVGTFFPAFSAVSDRRPGGLGELYSQAIRWSLIVAMPVVLVLTILANEVLDLWLGGDYAERSSLVFRLLLIGGFVGLLAPVANSLLQAVGRPDVLFKIYLIEIPINVMLVWVLINKFGLAGAGLSFVIRTAAETGALIWLTKKIVLNSEICWTDAQFLNSRLLVFFVLGLIGFVVGVLELKWRVLVGVVALGLWVIFSWHWLLSKTEKAALSQLLSNLF